MRTILLVALLASAPALADTWLWMGKPGAAAEKFGTVERATEQMQMDVAFCDYDSRKAAAAAPANRGYYAPGNDAVVQQLGNAIVAGRAGESLYYSCMASRGWYAQQ
jgi:hypothetical protein